MLTRLEISGFKTFSDFSIEFSPFTIIAGPNGSGKSNLFDAIQLLGRIAETDLQSAFADQRGESQELFTLRSDKSHVQRMSFAVEMLVDKQVRDKFGGEALLKYTRLRYELKIQSSKDKRGIERLTVAEERLAPIAKATDSWFNSNIATRTAEHWRPSTHGGAKPFIDTIPTENGNEAEIYMRQDGGGGRGRPSPALDTEQTVLSSVSKIDFLHVFAVKQEMVSWRFLQLNPVELRKPSPLLAKDIVAVDGSNLPTALARMMSDDPQVMRDLSREVHRILPGIKRLELIPDEPRQQYVLYATMIDGRRFSSRVLSEGTLRLIALCAFKYDEQYNGVLCFEEPENGIHPYRLNYMVQLLSDLSTDFSDAPNDLRQPASLRQLLVNTHSPGLLASLVALKNSLPFTALFASLATRVIPGEAPSQCTVMRPINFNRQHALKFDKEYEAGPYSLQEAINYLQSQDVKDAVENIKNLDIQKQ